MDTVSEDKKPIVMRNARFNQYKNITSILFSVLEKQNYNKSNRGRRHQLLDIFDNLFECFYSSNIKILDFTTPTENQFKTMRVV